MDTTETKLYLVPTPIGNLDDITLRAVKTLQSVDCILAEDTRNTGLLLKHLGIQKPLYSHHAHNEHTSVAGVVKLLKSGKKIALVSDAGTPGISDPGFLLVRECVREGIKVEALPGATAFVPALVASGLTSNTFHFEGFLPHKKGRQTRLKYLSSLENTFILYESPHRLVKCLEELATHCSAERLACVCRELTKIHEEVKTAPLSILLEYYQTEGVTKGEIVIVVEGKS